MTISTFKYNKLHFCVGRNSKSNWELLRSSNDTDIWIHLKNYPSCYVIIKCKKDILITGDHITYAGKLCCLYSKIKNSNKKTASISYIECKYVKKGKSSGQAILLKKPNEKNVKIHTFIETEAVSLTEEEEEEDYSDDDDCDDDY